MAQDKKGDQNTPKIQEPKITKKEKRRVLTIHINMEDGSPPKQQQLIKYRLTLWNSLGFIVSFFIGLLSPTAGDFTKEMAFTAIAIFLCAYLTATFERGTYNGIRYKGGPKWKPDPQPKQGQSKEDGKPKETADNKALKEVKVESPMNPKPKTMNAVKADPSAKLALPSNATGGTQNHPKNVATVSALPSTAAGGSLKHPKKNVTTVSAECHVEVSTSTSVKTVDKLPNLSKESVKASSNHSSNEEIAPPSVPIGSLSNLSQGSAASDSSNSSFEELAIPNDPIVSKSNSS